MQVPEIDSFYHYLFSPLAWGLLLLGVLLATWRSLPRGLRVSGVVLGLFCIVLCTPAGANVLVRFVESRAPSGGCPATEQVPIVVLSGGFERVPETVNDYAALTPESWRRLQGASQRWRGKPQRRLVIAGGGPYAIKESAALAALAADWGVSRDRIRFETKSTTTWQSAEALAGELPVRIELVTSAIHLPRALVAFRAAGFQPCAQASDSNYLPMQGPGYFVPQVTAMEKTETAVYEIAGMVVYRHRARKLASAKQ